MLEEMRRLPQTPWGAVGFSPITLPWASVQLQSWAATMVCRRQNGIQLRLLVQAAVGGGFDCSEAMIIALGPVQR